LGREAPFDLRGLSVLIVEDNADVRDVLAAMFDCCGALVTPASSARAALAWLDVHQADLIISDLGMPGEDGLWFIRSAVPCGLKVWLSRRLAHPELYLASSARLNAEQPRCQARCTRLEHDCGQPQRVQLPPVAQLEHDRGRVVPTAHCTCDCGHAPGRQSSAAAATSPGAIAWTWV
jgi:CheY-like chemotaxis protein